MSLFVVFSTAVMAQQSSTGLGFAKGDNLVNIGLGIGSPFFGTGYKASLPINPSISYERGITDAISIGGQFSYARSKYEYDFFGSGYSYKENAIYIGARGCYHFNELLDLDSKFDVYAGAGAGYVIVSISDNQGYTGSAGSEAGFGVFAGGKYYFAPKVSVYAELGYQSLSVLNVGIAFKF